MCVLTTSSWYTLQNRNGESNCIFINSLWAFLSASFNFHQLLAHCLDNDAKKSQQIVNIKILIAKRTSIVLIIYKNVSVEH